MKLRSFGIAAALCLFSTAAGAQTPLKVHPDPGLYGPDDDVCAGQGPVRVASVLCGMLDSAEERARWGRRFAELMTHRFGQHIRADLSEQLPDGLTREAMLAQTAVASLHLSRADLWTVRKPAAIEVHVPITLSLMMTNVLTGEVMFVENLTVDVQGLMTFESWEAEVMRQFPEQLDAAIVSVVDAALARFRPGAITGVVRGRAGDGYVVDIGRRDGVREGDELGADARVVFAEADYAVVRPALGTLTTGQVLQRHVARPVDNLARPSLLVAVAQAPDQMGSAYVTTVVEDAVAAAGGFALATVNPSSNNIRAPALGAAGVAPRARALPDYFLRVTVADLEPIVADTSVAGTRRRVQEAWAFFEVVNHEGRVVFATRGSDRRVDEITNGMAAPAEQRRDAAVKNAIVAAAASLARDFNPARLRLEVGPADDGVAIRDPGGVLGVGAQASVVRRAGRVAGIEGDVWAPVTQVEVIDTNAGLALARYADVEAPRIRSGDQIAYEAAGSGAPSRLIYAQCMVDGSLSVSVRGLEQPLFQPIAVNSFSHSFRGAVHVATFPDELSRLALHDIFPEFEALGVSSGRQPDVCFEPVHQVSAPIREREQGRDHVVAVHDLTAGYVLRRQGERVGAAGLQQVLNTTASPRTADADYRSKSLQIDLAGAMSDLTLRAARELTPSQ